MKPLPVYVINREKDTDRRIAFEAAAKLANMDANFFPAIDASMGAAVFAPYLSLIGDRFWGDEEVKPGAVGCFLSHYLLWQKIAQSHEVGAIVFEDDTTPIPEFWSHYPSKRGTTYELFCFNNRMTMLGRGETESMDDCVKRQISETNDSLWGDSYRAPGADGYFLSQTGAKKLIAAVETDQIQVGVDWYLLYAAIDSTHYKHRDIKHIHELKKLHKIFGGRPPTVSAAVSGETLSFINNDFQSTIQHRVRQIMDAFKADIRRFV